MNPRPCAALCTGHASKRRALPAFLALFALAALLLSTGPAQADDENRALASGPERHILVKAAGHGVDAAEAEQDALRNARLMAARHFNSLGGAAALDPSPQGVRVVASHSTPPMGLATVRAVVLVELRLRALPEPPPAALALPVLRISVDATPLVTVEANRPCEAMVAVDSGSAKEPEILPGGSGAAYRLAPGKSMKQPLPQGSAPASLRVLACTGGLYSPAVAPTLDEAFAKARAGRPRPAIMQGIVSECVEIKTALPARGDLPKRSMRQKGSQSPVNMTGAAGREAGLPLAVDPGKDQP